MFQAGKAIATPPSHSQGRYFLTLKPSLLKASSVTNVDSRPRSHVPGSPMYRLCRISRSRHSHYIRNLQDLPCKGLAVLVRSGLQRVMVCFASNGPSLSGGAPHDV
jgi:hypothetical protein